MQYHAKKWFNDASVNAMAAIAIGAMLIFSVAGMKAFADNVVNDVVVGGNDTITAGEKTTIQYKIVATSGASDGQTGCNAADSSSAKVTINAPSAVTASPGSLTFTSCNTQQSVVFSSSTPGDYEITVDVSDSGTGTYNETPATFTLHVKSPPPPSDTTAPEISYTRTPSDPDGNDGWYTSDVKVSWTVEENESPDSLQTNGCDTTTISTDTTGTDITCKATSDGGSSSKTVTIKRDATKPTILGSATPAANTDGWNNEDVTVTFDCNDATSDIASCDGGTTRTQETDTTGVTITGTATDNAGNSATDDVGPIKIDKTNPTNIQFTGGSITDNGAYYFGFVPTAPTGCTADDALSGLDHCSVDSTNGGTSVGSHSYVANAVDNADNSDSKTLSYTVNSWTLKGYYNPVTMSPSAPNEIIWNTLKGGQTVPLKFEIFAGATEITSTTLNNNPVGTFKTQKVSCGLDPSPVEDPVDLTTTGGTTFRYDSTSGQFAQNWQTAKAPNTCYTATFTAQDGSFLTAYFKLK